MPLSNAGNESLHGNWEGMGLRNDILDKVHVQINPKRGGRCIRPIHCSRKAFCPEKAHEWRHQRVQLHSLDNPISLLVSLPKGTQKASKEKQRCRHHDGKGYMRNTNGSHMYRSINTYKGSNA